VGRNGVGPWSSRSAIKGGRCEGIRFYWREWVGGILREETSSGSEWRVGMNLVFIPVSSFYSMTVLRRIYGVDVSWMKKQNETGLGGLGRPGARGKMRDPCCWSLCHDVTFPANLPEGSRPNLVWTANPRASRFPSIIPVGIDIEVEVRTVLHTPYSN